MGKEQTLDMFSKESYAQATRREVMTKARNKGTRCPCCGQFVKVYQRQINSTMAQMLMKAAKAFPGGQWFHIDQLGLYGDWSKLELWGLITRYEHKPGDNGRRCSGQWQVTALGEKFAHNRAMVKQYAIVYDGKLLELTGPELSIVDALGKKFDYNELMGKVAA